MKTNVRINKAIVLVLVLTVATLACGQIAPPAPTPTIEQVEPTVPLLEATKEESLPSPTAPPAMHVSINELDPCKLVTKENAEAAMGQAVDNPIIAEDETVKSCTYIAVPGERLVTVTVYEGDNAKNYLLNETAQLQNGCELHYSTSTNPEQPTPFPPDMEALRSESVLDLFLRDLAASEECGLSYSQVLELGDNAYSFQSIFIGATIGVATDNAFVIFIVGDINASSEQALDAAIQLIRELQNSN